MERVNRTRFAVLGVLSTGPQSGYDVKKFCEEVLAYFWRESYGQIYPLLRTLEAEGLIRKEKSELAEGDRRVAFVLTDSGRKELSEWLSGPVADQPPRNELLLKVFFSNLIGPAAVIPQVAAHEAAQQQLRQVLMGVLFSLDSEMDGDPQMPYWKMTVRLGLRICDARIEWCKETLKELQTIKEKSSMPSAAAMLE
ncbi:MAG: PadR family transcriptional regulator [Planctomyces sp.]|nr:PadR family transcriptional regulator [Planctomyces sp.]